MRQRILVFRSEKKLLKLINGLVLSDTRDEETGRSGDERSNGVFLSQIIHYFSSSVLFHSSAR